MQKQSQCQYRSARSSENQIAGGTIMIMKIKEITVAADCYNVHYTLHSHSLVQEQLLHHTTSTERRLLQI